MTDCEREGEREEERCVFVRGRGCVRAYEYVRACVWVCEGERERGRAREREEEREREREKRRVRVSVLARAYAHTCAHE